MEYITKDGKTITIREVQVEDADAIITCMDKIVLETKNLAREPEEWSMTNEQEIAYLTKVTTSDDDYMCIALDGDKVIATAGFHAKPLKRFRHRVTLGISLLEAYHRQGIGRVIMNHLIEQAGHMNKTQLDLEVRADNLGAIALYEQCGFVIEGRKKNGFYIDNTYVDELLMAYYIKE